MDVQFINEYEITVSLQRQWSRHPVTQKAKKARQKWLTLRVIGCIASIVVIVGSILTNDTPFIFIGGLFLALFIYRLFILPELALKKQYEQCTRMIGKGDWKRNITFGEDIIVEDGRNTQRFEYAELSQVKEDNDYFYLLSQTDIAIRVRKDSFIKGSAIEFHEYIKRKMSQLQQIYEVLPAG